MGLVGVPSARYANRPDAIEPTIPKRARRRLGVQPCEPRDGRGSTEDAADRRRVEAAGVELPGRGHPTRQDDLVPGEDRGEDVAPRRAVQLARCECGRRDHRRDVRTESEWVSSKSRPWQSIALAKAALPRAVVRRGRSPSPAAPRRAPSSSRGLRCRSPSRGPRAAAERVEDMQLRVSTTSAGTSSSVIRRAKASDRLCCGHLTPSSRRRCPGPGQEGVRPSAFRVHCAISDLLRRESCRARSTTGRSVAIDHS